MRARRVHEAQIEKLKNAIERAREKVLSELHRTYEKAESYFGKEKPEKEPSPEPPLPPDHPQPPAPVKEPPEPSEPPIQTHTARRGVPD